MIVSRFILRSVRRSLPLFSSSPITVQTLAPHYHHKNHLDCTDHHFLPQNPNPSFLISTRTFAYSSAEEAAAERRRRKRRLRIEPPFHALNRDAGARRPPPDPNAPRLPDTTSALVGPRLSLHNRVQSLKRAGDLDNASLVARQAVFSSTRPTVFTCNAIIAAMHGAKRYSDAIALFTYFFKQSNIVPNVVSYNYVILAHCDNGEVDKAFEVYRHILDNAPFSPSSVTYRHLTKGLIDAGRITEAVDLLREMLNKGQGADSLVYNNLISGFLYLENLDKANEFFDELKERCLVYDGVVNATFMEWFFIRGREREAMESYKSLLDRNFKMVPPTCNALIEVLLKYGKRAEAQALFESMLDNHTPPFNQAVNSDTISIMVNNCFKLGKASEAYSVFKSAGKAPKSRPLAMDTAGYNNIIARYCEHEMMEDAEKMYQELCGKSLSPDVITYKMLIDSYFKVGSVDDALEKYVKMVEAGLRVIPTYANKWFSELIEKGMIGDCYTILTKMGERDPKPDALTYDLVIKGLCGEGNFDASLDLLGQMVKYGVGIPPVLKEFALEAFGKAGRQAEVDRLLNVRWPAFSANIPQQRFAPRPGDGAQPEIGQSYGTAQQYEKRAQNVIGQHYRNELPYENELKYGNSQNYGAAQQNENRAQYESGKQYGHGAQFGNQQHTRNGQDFGNGPQYGSGPHYGNGPQYGNGPHYGNGQEYENGPLYGNGPQYSSGQQYASGTQYGVGPQYGSASQYGNDRQYGNEQQFDYGKPQTESASA